VSWYAQLLGTLALVVIVVGVAMVVGVGLCSIVDTIARALAGG
jgi:hypothetical protein